MTYQTGASRDREVVAEAVAAEARSGVTAVDGRNTPDELLTSSQGRVIHVGIVVVVQHGKSVDVEVVRTSSN